MNTAARVIQILWEAAALFLIASIISAPVIVVVRKARARGKRLFADQPDQRARSLHQDTTHLHETDVFQ